MTTAALGIRGSEDSGTLPTRVPSTEKQQREHAAGGGGPGLWGHPAPQTSPSWPGLCSSCLHVLSHATHLRGSSYRAAGVGGDCVPEAGAVPPREQAHSPPGRLSPAEHTTSCALWAPAVGRGGGLPHIHFTRLPSLGHGEMGCRWLSLCPAQTHQSPPPSPEQGHTLACPSHRAPSAPTKGAGSEHRRGNCLDKEPRVLLPKRRGPQGQNPGTRGQGAGC